MNAHVNITTNPLAEIVDTVASGQPCDTAYLLERLISRGSPDIPPEYGLALMRALRTNDWEEVGRRFCNGEAVSQAGVIFHIAPYTNRRSAAGEQQLCAVFGTALPMDMREVCTAGCQIGRSCYPDLVYGHFPPLIVPIRLINGAGLFVGKDAETFFPPEFWGFSQATQAPALLNVKLLRELTLGSAAKRIREIFTAESAEYLLDFHKDPELSEIFYSLEYQLHEVGHSMGRGINKKIADNWLQDNWTRAVEEWRADGMEYLRHEIATSALHQVGFEEASGGQAVLATNIILRFGIDAHREVDPEDVDRIASLLLFDRLLQGGDLDITSDGKLSLRKFRNGALVSTFGSSLASEARALTEAERSISDCDDYRALIATVGVSEEGKKAFARIVRRGAD